MNICGKFARIYFIGFSGGQEQTIHEVPGRSRLQAHNQSRASYTTSEKSLKKQAKGTGDSSCLLPHSPSRSCVPGKAGDEQGQTRKPLCRMLQDRCHPTRLGPQVSLQCPKLPPSLCPRTDLSPESRGQCYTERTGRHTLKFESNFFLSLFDPVLIKGGIGGLGR